MFGKVYNKVVSFGLATTPDETEQVFALLSDAVRNGLAAELKVAGDVHRYDLAAQRAYYFEKQGDGLAVWSWNEVRYYHEAGELIALVVASKAPLDENLANSFYMRATGRTVEQVPDITATEAVISSSNTAIT